MSENVNKSNVNVNENQKLINNLNDLNINSVNDENSDYESCEESIDCNSKQLDPEQENEIQTDDESDIAIESQLSAEELNRRKLESIELKTEGNKQFKEGLYEKSLELYTKALRLCPKEFTEERALMYGNRSAAEIHLNLKDNAIKDCSKAIQLNPNYLKALLRRAQLYRDCQKLDESLADYKTVLELDPNCSEANAVSHELQIQINDRNEKLKKEMMGKLKDLGNLVLRPFGLSTDNFKLIQNTETGGYSVNFQNN